MKEFVSITATVDKEFVSITATVDPYGNVTLYAITNDGWTYMCKEPHVGNVQKWELVCKRNLS